MFARTALIGLLVAAVTAISPALARPRSRRG